MAKNKNDIITLKQELEEKKLRNLYLFYGDEEFLKEYYIKKIIDLVPDCGLEEFNRISISGCSDYNIYDDAFEGMPMMTDKRTLLIRDSNIFSLRRSGVIIPPTDDEKAFWERKFSRLCGDTVVIFCEKNVDARSVLFKAAAKAGMTVKCEFLPDEELASIAIRHAAKAGKKIDKNVALYLVSVIDSGLNNLYSELDKLINFCDEVIYRSDVDRVVSKALSVQIFDITDGIIEKNPKKVFDVINNLKTQKESAFGVLYLIYANIEKMLHLKLAGARNKNDASEVLGVSSWVAARHLDSAAKFELDKLVRLVSRVPEIDYEIKNGKITEWQALEQFVLEALRG